MPMSKTKLKNAAIAAKSAALPSIPKELLDQFVTVPMTGEAVNAASMAFKKALIERALGAELGHHLGYPSGADKHERRFTGFDDKIGINAQLRKIIKTRGHFPGDDAASKLIWLALRNITADWGRAAHNWKEAMNQFAILYEERFTRTVA